MNNINNTWFIGEIANQQNRIDRVKGYKDYLSGKHKVLQRKDFYWKKEKFETTKLILQNAKTILNFHSTFLVGKPINLVGTETIVKEYNKIYRKFNYNKINYSIVDNTDAFGDVFEYVYKDNGVIKSKLIKSENGFPVYKNGEMVNFIEHWKDGEVNNYNIYYVDRVEVWREDKGKIEMLTTALNPTGLPIHYHNANPNNDMYGRSDLEDLIPIFDCIEDLLSKMQDAIYTLSLNPIATVSGSTWEDGKIDTDVVGSLLELEGGSVFDFKNAQIDYNTIKLYLDTLQQQLSVIAKIPSVAMGNTNVANVSEVSLKMLYNLAIMKALETEQWLKDGIYQRHQKMLLLMDKEFSDDEYIDITFNYNIPVNKEELINILYKQWQMGAISIQTIIERSEETNVTVELERLKAEAEKKERTAKNSDVLDKDNKQEEKVSDENGK